MRERRGGGGQKGQLEGSEDQCESTRWMVRTSFLWPMRTTRTRWYGTDSGLAWDDMGLGWITGAGWLVSCWAWALASGLGLVLVLVACRAGNQGFPQVDQAQGRR